MSSLTSGWKWYLTFQKVNDFIMLLLLARQWKRVWFEILQANARHIADDIFCTIQDNHLCANLQDQWGETCPIKKRTIVNIEPLKMQHIYKKIRKHLKIGTIGIAQENPQDVDFSSSMFVKVFRCMPTSLQFWKNLKRWELHPPTWYNKQCFKAGEFVQLEQKLQIVTIIKTQSQCQLIYYFTL